MQGVGRGALHPEGMLVRRPWTDKRIQSLLCGAAAGRGWWEGRSLGGKVFKTAVLLFLEGLWAFRGPAMLLANGAKQYSGKATAASARDKESTSLEAEPSGHFLPGMSAEELASDPFARMACAFLNPAECDHLCGLVEERLSKSHGISLAPI